MILIIMGLLDLFAGVGVFFAKFGILSNVCLFLGGYLILKGLIFIKSITSILDAFSGVLIILLVLGFNVPFYWLISIWLIQKGVISFISL